MHARRVIGIYPSEKEVLKKLTVLKRDGMETKNMMIIGPYESAKKLSPTQKSLQQRLIKIGVSEGEAKLYSPILDEGRYILLNTVIHKKYLT